jgi:hypothetical protein
MARKKTKKKRSTVYKSITFKLTKRQKKSLEAYCAEHKIGMLRMIKKSIQQYLNRPDNEKYPDDHISENQLDLFIEAQLASEDADGYNKTG